ncbi:tetratricopeptide repeat protein [Thalassobacillus pellis]|uniref:tetratricopeptide repeat protein n=1 Tax=Thalassobacillus pellis TaxID=748008 RepID=UPI00195F4101|nr:tetratricopeptide (TPR) repeat protein [Thalassobacillus pellis]
MNLRSRIDYLCNINGLTIDMLDIPVEELDMLEQGMVHLPPSSIQRLSTVFDRPASYFEEHEEVNPCLHQLLIEFQQKLQSDEGNMENLIVRIESYQPIPSLQQEVIYHLLLAVYHYKKQRFDHASWLEDNFLCYFLDKYPILKQNIIFDKAMFHYLGVKYYYMHNFDESKRYFEELLELSKEDREHKADYSMLTHFSQGERLRA